MVTAATPAVAPGVARSPQPTFREACRAGHADLADHAAVHRPCRSRVPRRGLIAEQRMFGVESGVETLLPPRQKRRFSRGNPAGATGLEPATPGFGDRCATNCATPLGCGAQCTPTLLVTLCHEPCSGTRSQPCSPQSRSRSRSSRSGRRSREGAHGSLRSPLRRSPSGWGTSPGESGQADGAIWPTRWDESAGRRRILLGW